MECFAVASDLGQASRALLGSDMFGLQSKSSGHPSEAGSFTEPSAVGLRGGARRALRGEGDLSGRGGDFAAFRRRQGVLGFFLFRRQEVSLAGVGFGMSVLEALPTPPTGPKTPKRSR